MPLWLIAVAAGAVLIIASIIYSRVGQTKKSGDTKPAESLIAPSKPVTFTSNIPNTRFSENGKPLAANSTLVSGNHLIEGSADGYISDSKPLMVPASKSAPLRVDFVLHPVLPELRIASPLNNGSLVIDGGVPANLESGSLTKNDFGFGAHRSRFSMAIKKSLPSHLMRSRKASSP